MKNKMIGLQALVVTGILSGLASAQSTNAGADAITDQIDLLVPVAVGVIGAAVLVVVVPWGAKMAIRAFKSICGG